MNPEFEKLFEAAFTDGFITPKELEVLKKKALKLGISEGELEIMINARQYTTKQDSDKRKGNTNKCPNCGAKINPEKDIFCPSCNNAINKPQEEPSGREDVITDSEYYTNCTRKSINEPRIAQRSELQGSGWQIFKWFNIIFSGGLYIPFKLLFKKEPVFDGKKTENQIREAKADIYATMVYVVNNGVGDDAQLAKSIVNGWKKKVQLQRLKDFFVSLLWFVLFGLPAYGIYMAVTNKSKAKPIEKEAPKPEAKVSKKVIKKQKSDSIIKLTDSLVNTGNTDLALKAIAPLKDEESDKYLTQKVTQLTADKKFSDAMKLTEKIESYDKYESKRQVQLAIALDKYATKK